MTTTELAKIAYGAYSEHTAWKNFWGAPVSTWETLPEKLREAWIHAVQAVLVAVEGTPIDLQIGDEP